MRNFDSGGAQVKASYLGGCSDGLIHHPLLFVIACCIVFLNVSAPPLLERTVEGAILLSPDDAQHSVTYSGLNRSQSGGLAATNDRPKIYE